MKILPTMMIVLGGLMCVCGKPAPDFLSLPKIDVHTHVMTDSTVFLEEAEACNFTLLTIAWDSSDPAAIKRKNGFAKKHMKRFPGRIAFATTFEMLTFGTPGWTERVIEQLARDFDEGAIAVKVWKDIGMTFRDSDSSFIMIDDPLFDPVLDFIESQDKTLVGHLGEPRNCWLPLDEMTVRGDSSYFADHPEYHMYLHPEYPSYEDQINARDRMLAKHPGIRFVGCHLGSLEWDVDELAKRLDRYPNFSVDTASRMCHFQVQDSEKVRSFILKYQDRILYGTDLYIDENYTAEEARIRIRTEWNLDWKYLAAGEEMTVSQLDGSFQGLELPADVLKKIYYSNAKRMYREI